MSKRVNAANSKTKTAARLSLHKKVVTASAIKRKVLSSIASNSSRQLDESNDFSDVQNLRTRSTVTTCRQKIQSKLPDQILSATSTLSAGTSTSADDIAESCDLSEQLDSVGPMLEKIRKLCPSCNRLILDAFEDHVKMCLREKFQSGRQSPVLLQQQADDEALARQLQEQEAGKVSGTMSESDPICCQICQKDLSHLNSQRRLQHVNACIDMSEKNEKERQAMEKEMCRLRNVGLDCPMCGRHHKAESSRQTHMKKCANELKVPREQLLELLKQQKEEQDLKLAAIQPSDLKRVQVKGKTSSSSVNRAHGQRKPKKQETDEDTQVALALSSSIIEEQQKQERQLIAQLTQMREAAGLEGGQRKGKAPTRKGRKNKDGPVSLLMQLTAEEARRRIEQRASMLLASQQSEPNLPSTPVFIGSTLTKALTEGVAYKTLYQRDLWHLAGHTLTSSVTKDIRLAYYVSKLMPPVTMSCVEAGSKIKRMSIIPGRNVSMLKDLKHPVIHEAGLEHQILSQDEACQFESSPAQTQTLTILAELAAEADEPDLISISSTQSGNSAHGASPEEGDSIQASGFCPEERLVLTRTGQELQASALNELPSCLSALVDDHHYSDIKLITKGGGSVSGHRVIISAFCSTLLQSACESDCLDLSDFSHDAVKCFMKFIYAREFIPTCSILDEVKLLAERYNLPTLSSLCQHVETANAVTLLPDRYGEETTDLDNINNSLDTLMKTLWDEEEDILGDVQQDNNSSTDDKQGEELEEAIEFLVSQQLRNYTNSNSNSTGVRTKPLSNVISVDSVNSENAVMLTDELMKECVEFKNDNEEYSRDSNTESVHSQCLSTDIPVCAKFGKTIYGVDDYVGEEMDFERDCLAIRIKATASDDDDDINAETEPIMDIQVQSSDSSENSESSVDLVQQQHANRCSEPDKLAANRSYSRSDENNRIRNEQNTSINDLIRQAASIDEPDYSFIHVAASQVMSKELRQIYERRSMSLMNRMESKSLNQSCSELFSDDEDESDINGEDARLVNINIPRTDVCVANLDTKPLVVNANEGYETIEHLPSKWLSTTTVYHVISDSTDTSVSYCEKQNTNKINMNVNSSDKVLPIDNIEVGDSRINDVDSVSARLSDRGEDEPSSESKETSWLIPGTPEDKAALSDTADAAVYTQSYKICLPTLSNITNYSGSSLDKPSYKQDGPSSCTSSTNQNEKLHTSKRKTNESDEYSNSRSAESNVGGMDMSILKYDDFSKEPSHNNHREYQNHTCLINRSALCSELSFSNADATQSGPQMSTPMMETHRSRTHTTHKRQSIQLSPVHLNLDTDEVNIQHNDEYGDKETADRKVNPTPDSGSKRLLLIADPHLVLGSRPFSGNETNDKFDQSHDNIQTDINSSCVRADNVNNEYVSSPKFHGKSLKPSKKGELQNKGSPLNDLSDSDSEEIVLLMETGVKKVSANVNNASVIKTPSHDKSIGLSPSETHFLVVNNSPKLSSVKQNSNMGSDTDVNNSPTLTSRVKRRSNMMSDMNSHSSSSCSDSEVSNRHFSKRQKFDLVLEKSELPEKLCGHVHEKDCEKSTHLPSPAIDLTGDSDEEELQQTEHESANPDKVATEMDGHDGATMEDHRHGDATYNDAGVWDDFDDDGFGMNIVTCSGQSPDLDGNRSAPDQEMMIANAQQENNEEIRFSDNEHLMPTVISQEHNSSHNDSSLHALPSDGASQNEAHLTNVNSPCVRLYANAGDCEVSDLDSSFAASESDYGKSVSVITCMTTNRSGGRRTGHDISMSDAEDQLACQVPDVAVKHTTPTQALKPSKTSKKKTVWYPPSPFTPMPEYEKMATHLLKEAVQNVGVRPVGKKRMILFLKDVYHQTHRYETDSEFEGSFSAVKAAIEKPIITSKRSSASHVSKKVTSSNNASKKLSSAAQVVSKPRNFFFEKPANSVSPAKRASPVKSRKKTDTDKACSDSNATMAAGGGSIPSHRGDVGSSSTSQESTDESYDEMLEESVLGSEVAATDQECEPDLNLKLMRMFKGDHDLYNRILLYEPLEFDWLKGRVKEAGIKCAAPKLQNFLDDRCITFTMRSQRSTVKRRGRVKKTNKIK